MWHPGVALRPYVQQFAISISVGDISVTVTCELPFYLFRMPDMTQNSLKIRQVDIAHRMAEDSNLLYVTKRFEKVAVAADDFITSLYIVPEIFLGELYRLFDCIISYRQPIAMHSVTLIIVKISEICKFVVGEIVALTVFQVRAVTSAPCMSVAPTFKSRFRIGLPMAEYQRAERLPAVAMYVTDSVGRDTIMLFKKQRVIEIKEQGVAIQPNHIALETFGVL